ncbi:MAG: glycoside hydrolase family 15 protein [Dermatophilaceae bacterium]
MPAPKHSLRPRVIGRRLLVVVALVAAGLAGVGSPASAAGTASDGPGGGSSWTTGNKVALGTSSTTTSKVWFTVARGITSEVFYPRADVANVQDMQYVVTDGSTFVDLERDATNHVVSMPDEKALEYTITNTAKSGKYRLTNTYVTDPTRNTLLLKTRFQSLDGGTYRVYVLYNPSLAGGSDNDNVWWDGANGALMASDSQSLFGSTLSVATALKVSSGWAAHDNGYVGKASDGYVDLKANKILTNQFDNVTTPGNTVQVGQVAGIAADTTFTLALGFGSDATTALSAANGSLTAGFASVDTSFRGGWNTYVNGLTMPTPASVSGDTLRRRTYYVGVMSLHAAEDKTNPGASVAGLATPWGDYVNGATLNDGYHRVWGRDLYQQGTAMLAVGDAAQAQRMAKFLWTQQYISTATAGDGTTYQPGSFPRYTPVSGVVGATPQQLGCCEQLDQNAFAITLAWMTGLTDSTTYAKIKTTANRIQSVGPDTASERWEEQAGKSPSTIAAEIAGLISAADIARTNGDTASATSWQATADSWRNNFDAWTFTTAGYWGDHQYYERIENTTDPNDGATRSFIDGTWYEHDITDAGFLDLVRLGLRTPTYGNIANSLPETDTATDAHATMKITMPNGDVYWHRYNHDSYGESSYDGTGWPAGQVKRWGRLWPLLTGERGEYELANGRSATLHLQSMADSANDGYFVPEQIWDEADAFGFVKGKATGSAGPLMWAEAQYVRLAQGIDATRPVETPTVVQGRYGVKVTLTANVPASTDATTRNVYVAGTFNTLNGVYPGWVPGHATSGRDGLKMTRINATTWGITFVAWTSQPLQYKYVLDSQTNPPNWNYVEKNSSCADISNRTLTTSTTEGSTQSITDTVSNWALVSPC